MNMPVERVSDNCNHQTRKRRQISKSDRTVRRTSVLRDHLDKNHARGVLGDHRTSLVCISKPLGGLFRQGRRGERCRRGANHKPCASPTATAATESPSPPFRPRVALCGSQATYNLEDRLRSNSDNRQSLGLEAAQLKAEHDCGRDVRHDDEKERGVAIHVL